MSKPGSETAGRIFTVYEGDCYWSMPDGSNMCITGEDARLINAGLPRWKPIETAPKTTTARLVWCPERKNIYVVSWWDNGHPHPGPAWVHFGGSGGTLMEEPTHWMPLPEPPL